MFASKWQISVNNGCLRKPPKRETALYDTYHYYLTNNSRVTYAVKSLLTIMSQVGHK